MAFKLLKTAEERWRRFNGHELVADVLAGAKFKDGIKVTEDDTHNDPDDRREGRRRLTVFTPCDPQDLTVAPPAR